MKRVLLVAMLLLPASAWAADLKLDAGSSDISFVSVKKGSVGEVHHFTRLSGEADAASASVSIDLSSVESGIAKRNERMKSMLFDVSRFATATISADVSALNAGALIVGQRTVGAVTLNIDLHGVKHQLPARVSVVRLKDGALLVSSRSPVIVKAADFGLDGGIEALREAAKLPSIATSVPVSFELLFH